MEGLRAIVSAKTALLHPTEAHIEGVKVIVINPNLAGAYIPHHPLRPCHVLSEHRRSQPILSGISLLDSLIDIFKWFHDAKHRTKDFLPGQP